MTVENDLIQANEDLAARQTRISFLLEGTADMVGTEAADRAKALKSATDEVDTLIERRNKLQREVTGRRLERDAVKAGHSGGAPRQIIPTNDGDYGSPLRSPRQAGADWGEAVVKANEEQSGSRGIKSLLPSGTAVVEVPVGGPVTLPQRARFLADLLPAESAPGGHFSYLRQTVRTNNAAVVAEAGLKPTSIFTLERIDDTTDVIAHLSEALPRPYFDDSAKIRGFIDSEMTLGVKLAVDAKIVADILGAGILVEGSLGNDLLFASRRGITRLEEREVVPTAFVMSPRDFEEAERLAAQTFAANSNQPAPTDSMARRLWGVPVVVTNAITEGTVLLGDFSGAAALYVTGGIRIDWSEGGDMFSHNQIQFRAEGRFATAIYRSFAFIEIAATGTGS